MAAEGTSETANGRYDDREQPAGGKAPGTRATPPGTRRRAPPTTEANRRGTGRKSGRGKAAVTAIRIARIETAIMTADEYTDAVEALAVLIARYEHAHPPPGGTPS